MGGNPFPLLYSVMISSQEHCLKSRNISIEQLLTFSLSRDLSITALDESVAVTLMANDTG
jgi:hypothetical protein